MFKKYLLIFIAAFALITTSGCSLFSSDSEEPKEEAVSEDTVSDEEVSDSTEETVADSDEEEVVDEYPDDDYGSDGTAVAATDDASATPTEDDSSALPDQPVDGAAQEDTLLVDGTDTATSTAATEDTSSSYSAPVQDSSTSMVSDSYVPESNYIPVQKMKKTPFTRGGAVLNRLYIVRNGDTLESIAQKTMGDGSRSNDLMSWNPTFQSKGIKVGDKVYYSSVKNPNDNSQILLYYEEAGVQPSYYTGKSGDSLRKVAKNLLGHERSWMEIYATNDSVDDKWQLAEGTQVRYWPDGTAAAPMQAQAAAEPAPAPEEPVPTEEMPAVEEPAMTADAGSEPAPTEEMPAAPDESGMATAAAQMEEPPAPPPEATPPPAAQIEPPAPPAEEGSGSGLADLMGGGEDDSMMVAILGGLLVVAALIMIVFIRRGRKKVNYG